MPTFAELKEFRTKCDWEYNYNGTGVNGFKVKPRQNENYIFLPAAGYRVGTIFKDVGVVGRYWSSSLYPVRSNCAYTIHFIATGYVEWQNAGRSDGNTVRAVCPK